MRQMSFSEAIKSVLTTNYANFSGRARRSEYWYFVLFNYILYFACLILGSMSESMLLIFSIIYLLACLAMLIPSFAVCVRRLHDIGKSGWNLLWGFLPVIGWILLIIWYCKDSQPGKNNWGDNPKGVE